MPTAGLRNVVDRLRHAATRKHVACGELLERFVANRDEDAFAELVRRHGPRVYAVCRRVLGQHQLAEDAFQAVFVVLTRKAHAVQPRSAVGGFLYGVARKAALEAYAVSRRRKETLAAQVPETPAATSTAVDSDVLAMLDDEIANLSDALRAAVVLCELDGVSRAAAARHLGIAEGTLSSRLAAARKQLAARLAKRGVAFSAALFAAVAQSATAAPPVSLAAPLPPTVSAIATGVMRTMMFSKLKLATLAVVLMAFLGAGALVPKGGMEVSAAPVPKAEKDDGHIWLHNTKSGALTAHTPDGKEVRKLTIQDGKHFLGLTPGGTKVLFAGKGGEAAPDDAERLTLHRRDIGEGTAGEDLGVPYQGNDQFVWSPDGTKVVRTRVTELEIVNEQRYHIFENRLFDLAAKADEKIDVPKDHQIVQWSADGKTWRAIHNNVGRDPKLPNYRWHTVPVAGGKPTPINDDYSLMWLEPSPDGKTFLATGWNHPIRKPGTKWFNLTAATGKFQEVARFEKAAFAVMRWSPDGTRVAYARFDYDPDTGVLHDTTLFTAAPDGTDVRELARFANDNQNTQFLGWFPAKAKPKVDPRTMTFAPIPKEKPAPPGTVAFFQQSVGQLRLIGPDGGPETLLKDVALSDQVRLSPDGKQVAYFVFGGERGTRAEVPRRVFVRAVDGDGPGTDLGIFGRSMAWSPDGKELAVTDYDTGNPAAQQAFVATHAVVEVATKKATPLLLPKGNVVLDWSRDGKQFLTAQVQTKAGQWTNHRMYLFSREGKELQALGPPRATILYGRFSPDGRQVLGLGEGASKPGDSFRKVPVVIDLATNAVTPIPKVAENADAESVCWSPDGKRLAYSWKARGGGTTEEQAKAVTTSTLTVCDLDGTNAKALATAKADGAFTVIFGSLDWR